MNFNLGLLYSLTRRAGSERAGREGMRVSGGAGDDAGDDGGFEKFQTPIPSCPGTKYPTIATHFDFVSMHVNVFQ